jgi:enoyl-CoA hydratase/carnithine racemase
VAESADVIESPDPGGEAVVRVTRTAGSVQVVLNRPERHNAMTQETYRLLLELCAELRDDRSVRSLVLRGAGGRAFSAGNDIADFTRMDLAGGGGGQDGVAYETGVTAVLRAVAELPQVTIAAVEGVCVGGGLALATHCDVRICTAGSRFGYPIARTLGNALSAEVVERCAAVFGESLTREMLLLSRLVDAQRSFAVGAVAAVVDPADLDEEVAAIVDGVARASTQTVRATKEQLLLQGRARAPVPNDDDRLAAVYGAADFREGVAAFLGKRPPRFE